MVAGIYNSNDVAVSFPNVVSGSGSSTPVSSSHIPQQSSGHLQQVGALSPSAASSVTPAAATTQVCYSSEAALAMREILSSNNNQKRTENVGKSWSQFRAFVVFFFFFFFFNKDHIKLHK